jgi:catechol 2,3-dioxygenase-like lactoylglutathione lyase family enzyme
MQIKLTSVFVDDQEKALKFYTEILGFQKKMDFPGGGKYRWLTVVSPEETEGVQLEPRPTTFSEPSPTRRAGPFSKS